MRIRVKRNGIFGSVRVNSLAKIDSVKKKTDPKNPQNEVILLYFKGKDASGIVSMSKDEAKSLANLITLKRLRNRIALKNNKRFEKRK